MTSKLMLGLIALLLAVTLIGIPVVGLQINAVADQVTMTPTHHFGDPAMLEGLDISMKTTLNDHLFWFSEYTPVTGEITTEYDFTVLRRSETIAAPASGVTLDNNFHYGHADINAPDADEVPGLIGAYNRLYHETKNGESREITIKLSDYYDYYPITGRINFGFVRADLDWEDAHLTYTPTPESMQYVGWRFNQYFKLPLVGDETITISIDKSANGSSIGIGSSTAPDAKEQNYYSLSTATVVIGDICYFTINGLDGALQPIDTSQIEGGYGIYTVSLRNRQIDADSITNVYPLDIGEGNPVGIFATPDESRLLLYRVVGKTLTLTVIDRATMQPVQTLTVADNIDPGRRVSFDTADNFHLLMLDYDRMLLLDADEDGRWSVRIDIPTDREALSFVYESLTGPLRYLYPTQVMAWDGKRLAIADFSNRHSYGPYTACDLYLAILTADGLAYLGVHESSLNSPTDPQNSNEACWPTDYPLELRWR